MDKGPVSLYMPFLGQALLARPEYNFTMICIFLCGIASMSPTSWPLKKITLTKRAWKCQERSSSRDGAPRDRDQDRRERDPRDRHSMGGNGSDHRRSHHLGVDEDWRRGRYVWGGVRLVWICVGGVR